MTTTAKLFRNGRSQAVRLPREFRFEGDRVGVAFSWNRCSQTSRSGSPSSTGLGRSHSCPTVVASHPHPSETDSMTTYLLDTNTCIALINGTPNQVRRRFQRAVAKNSVILLSSVVAFELWYGVAKSQRRERNTQRLEAFLAGPLEWTLFDDEDARAAGTVRAKLETAGKPIGAHDVLLHDAVARCSSRPTSASSTGSPV